MSKENALGVLKLPRLREDPLLATAIFPSGEPLRHVANVRYENGTDMYRNLDIVEDSHGRWFAKFAHPTDTEPRAYTEAGRNPTAQAFTSMMLKGVIQLADVVPVHVPGSAMPAFYSRMIPLSTIPEAPNEITLFAERLILESLFDDHDHGSLAANIERDGLRYYFYDFDCAKPLRPFDPHALERWFHNYRHLDVSVRTKIRDEIRQKLQQLQKRVSGDGGLEFITAINNRLDSLGADYRAQSKMSDEAIHARIVSNIESSLSALEAVTLGE